MDPALWALVPAKLQELGISFAPIYGAEPLMVMPSLLNFIKNAKGRFPVSVITNGTLLTTKNIEELKEAGLESITVPRDITYIDKSTALKSISSDSALQFLKKNFKDVEVICTVTKDNWKLLPELIKQMTALGIWVHFDFYHWNKGQPGSKCAGMAELPSIDEIEEGAIELHKLKDSGYLIHSSTEALIYLRTCPNQAYYEYWKCEGGSFVTLNCDGNIYPCDDYQPESMKDKFPILKFNETWDWDTFVKVCQKEVLKCPGCFWLTHIQSEIYWNETNYDWKKEMIHETNEVKR